MRYASTIFLAAAAVVASGVTTEPVRSASATPSASSPLASLLAQYKPKDPKARARFEAGNRLYQSGADAARPLSDRVRDLHAALAEYEAGQRIEPAPAFEYNCGKVAEALGDATSAVLHLERFLARAQPARELRVAVEQRLDKLDPSGSIRAAQLAAASEPQRPMEGSPAAASHALPPPSSATPPPNSAALPPSSAALPPSSASPSLSPSGPVLPDRTTSGRGWTYLGWGLTLAGLAGGGVTAWLAVSASQLDTDAMDASKPTSERVTLEHRADSRRHAALGVGIGSGVALVAGVITLVIPARASHRSTSTAWNVGFTGSGAVVFGRF